MSEERDERGRRFDEERQRKERVLHTRVPEVLAEELKRLAETMRVPVSNVVRTFLEDAVDTVSAMGRHAEIEIRDLADRLGRERRAQTAPPPAAPPAAPSQPPAPIAPPAPPPSAPPLVGIIAFQSVILARDAVCALSGRELHTGDPAYLGIRETGEPPVVFAPECVPINMMREEDPTPDGE